jgi:hypothetical protein
MAGDGPSRAITLLADWGNTIAGLLLMCAFLEGALINSVGVKSLIVAPGVPTDGALKWLQFFFCSEGFFYAFAEFFMVGVMASTPAEFGGGARGCMQFAILMAGGIFFAFSGLAFPSCITNVTYVFNSGPCKHPAAWDGLTNGGTPYVWNAVAHYGITCFMIGTSIGLIGVLRAPKNEFISLFYGCLMYFLGAWTIGIFKFWGPVLCGGFNGYQNEGASGFDFTAPAVAWNWTWWFALLGAFFLFLGAVIFGIMNKSYGSFSRRAANSNCANERGSTSTPPHPAAQPLKDGGAQSQNGSPA